MEINVKISCPDLTLAAAAIAKAMAGHAVKGELLSTLQEGPAPAAPAPAAPAPASPAPAAPAHAAAAIPTNPVPAIPTNPVPTAPVNAPAAPTAPAPQITLEQIGKAGADLLNKNPAIMPQLSALLQKYGVQTVQQLKPEMLGAFVLELRGLGASI